jgi:hypothetical protein
VQIIYAAIAEITDCRHLAPVPAASLLLSSLPSITARCCGAGLPFRSPDLDRKLRERRPFSFPDEEPPSATRRSDKIT